MNKTKKIKRYINNIENKYNECLKIIPNSYEPFEKDFMTNKESSNHEKEIIHMINQPFTNKNIQPNNDFYDYINLNSIKALKKTYKNISKKEKYYVQVDDFRIVQDHVNLELLKIIKEEIKNPVSEQSKTITTTKKTSSVNSRYAR